MNFFDVLDKYEYWKENCEKSVLGEFSSVVSIFCNKGTQSDLGAPGRGYGGPFLRLWVFHQVVLLLQRPSVYSGIPGAEFLYLIFSDETSWPLLNLVKTKFATCLIFSLIIAKVHVSA